MHVQALHELLGCLLDSAVQRTPRGGQVRVSPGRAADGRVKVDIVDTGQEMAQRLNEVLQSQVSSSTQVAPMQTPRCLG